MARMILIGLISLLCRTAEAREFKGVQMPDSIHIGSKDLGLNGMALLRKQSIYDVYVAGLYVERELAPPVQEAKQILDSPAVKHLVMHFKMYVPGSLIREGWEKGLKRNSDGKSDFQSFLSKLNGWMKNLKKDDKIELTFHPEKVDVAVKGETQGSIESADFSRALLSVFIGIPPDEDFKKSLLGAK